MPGFTINEIKEVLRQLWRLYCGFHGSLNNAIKYWRCSGRKEAKGSTGCGRRQWYAITPPVVLHEIGKKNFCKTLLYRTGGKGPKTGFFFFFSTLLANLPYLLKAKHLFDISWPWFTHYQQRELADYFGAFRIGRRSNHSLSFIWQWFKWAYRKPVEGVFFDYWNILKQQVQRLLTACSRIEDYC